MRRRRRNLEPEEYEPPRFKLQIAVGIILIIALMAFLLYVSTT